MILNFLKKNKDKLFVLIMYFTRHITLLSYLKKKQSGNQKKKLFVRAYGITLLMGIILYLFIITHEYFFLNNYI